MAHKVDDERESWVGLIVSVVMVEPFMHVGCMIEEAER